MLLDEDNINLDVFVKIKCDFDGADGTLYTVDGVVNGEMGSFKGDVWHSIADDNGDNWEEIIDFCGEGKLSDLPSDIGNQIFDYAVEDCINGAK